MDALLAAIFHSVAGWGLNTKLARLSLKFCVVALSLEDGQRSRQAKQAVKNVILQELRRWAHSVQLRLLTA